MPEGLDKIVNFEFASISRRLAAGVIDVAPIVFLQMLEGLPLGDQLRAAVAGGHTDAFMSNLMIYICIGTSLFYLCYMSVADGGRGGATLGKRMVGIRVIRAKSGLTIGYARSASRWFFAFLLPFVGFLASLSWADTGGSRTPLLCVTIATFSTLFCAAMTAEKSIYYDLLFQTRVVRACV